MTTAEPCAKHETAQGCTTILDSNLQTSKTNPPQRVNSDAKSAAKSAIKDWCLCNLLLVLLVLDLEVLEGLEGLEGLGHSSCTSWQKDTLITATKNEFQEFATFQYFMPLSTPVNHQRNFQSFLEACRFISLW